MKSQSGLMRTNTCTPRPPDVFGIADDAQLVEDGLQHVDGDGARVVEFGARLRIEVDAEFVGVLGVGAANLPRMQRDGAHLGGPRDRRRMRHLERIGGAPRRERDVTGSRDSRDALPERAFGRSPRRRYRRGTVADAWAGPVVRPAWAATPPTGSTPSPCVWCRRPELREVHLVRTGKPNGNPVDVDLPPACTGPTRARSGSTGGRSPSARPATRSAPGSAWSTSTSPWCRPSRSPRT